MTGCIKKACNAAFYHLHNLRCIKKYLSRDSLITLVHAFITSRLDYCRMDHQSDILLRAATKFRYYYYYYYYYHYYYYYYSLKYFHFNSSMHELTKFEYKLSFGMNFGNHNSNLSKTILPPSVPLAM